ncbi:o-succinylbenzoate--CoA ligase [Bacillus suaedaesalsae]|uniref:2-succinylbenzoate--CoA ligase n=1 Tax=Bacillus suaedaesalsae TaxID=2810349 RepID=A0ABS2DHT8_9BACI|nr:o-succinylbenzoate--CoA ligase [Bacillus suaedaesalsae]MBM6618054.1 o-succinylbenzoate--CoA ligase [Bacillus suaedaesalsae]
MSIQQTPNWLMQRAYLTPDRVALQKDNQQLTFQQLHENVSIITKKLHCLGIKKDARVAILAPNSIQMVELLHACKYIGVITVLLNTRLTTHELVWQIEDADVEAVFADGNYFDLLGDSSANVIPLEVLNETQPKEDGLCIQTEFELGKPDTIMYTSGTTGSPKGVIHTYGNHYYSAVGSALNLGLHHHDVWLACVPFFHVSGLSILMKSVIYGMKVIIHEGFDPKVINHSIQTENVTMISLVSTMLQQVLTDLKESNQTYPEALRCVLLGGGPAPKSLLERSKELGIPVYQTYGMTETASQIVTLSPEYSLTKLGSAGKPLFHSQVKIMNEGKMQESLQPGEIVVKGPTVTSGYYKREEATLASIQDGWLSTGDIGYLDEDGFLFVLDRRKDLIISGGENIYPAEIESVLLSHLSIQEAGVIGKDDDRWGQVPVAFVVATGITESEVKKYCLERLAKYKVPAEVRFVTELPRNATNKLQRHKLQEYLR